MHVSRSFLYTYSDDNWCDWINRVRPGGGVRGPRSMTQSVASDFCWWRDIMLKPSTQSFTAQKGGEKKDVYRLQKVYYIYTCAV